MVLEFGKSWIKVTANFVPSKNSLLPVPSYLRYISSFLSLCATVREGGREGKREGGGESVPFFP